MSAPVEAPVDYRTQALLSANVWGLYGIDLFVLLLTGLHVCFTLYKGYVGRFRVYRDAFFLLMAASFVWGTCALSVDYWNDITVISWNDTPVQSAFWQFLFGGFALAFLTTGVMSFGPNFNVVRAIFKYKEEKKKEKHQASSYYPMQPTSARGKHRSGDSGSAPESRSEDQYARELAECDIYASPEHHLAWGPVLAGAAFLVAAVALSFQQYYIKALWQLAGPAMFVALVLLILYIFYMVAVYRLPHYVAMLKNQKDPSKKDRKKFYRFYLAVLFINMLCSIIAFPVAAGLSPALASDQATFSTSTAVTIIYTAIVVDALFFLALSFYAVAFGAEEAKKEEDLEEGKSG